MASFQVTLTPEEAVSLLAKFGTSGTLPETDGVSLSYASSIDTGSADTVTFTIVKKPFYVSIGQIEHHVRGLLGI